MRTMTAFTLALAAATLVGCEAREAEDEAIEPGQELPQTPDPQPVPDEMLVSSSEFQAVGESGATPVRGTAELRRVTDDGSLELYVRLEGLSEGNHAWHIHGAPCGEQGGVVVPLSGAGGQDGIHGDLEVGGDGVVEQRVTLDAEHVRTLQLDTQHALNVHSGSGDNPGAPVACANIGGSTTGGAAGAAGTPNTGN